MLEFDFIKDRFLSIGIAINEHYLDRYIRFILSLPEIKGGYGEYHHILPKIMFPEHKLIGDSCWNQKRIDARAHYLCHWMLWKAFPRYGPMATAFWGMCVMKRLGRSYKINSKAYGSARLDHRNRASEFMKGRTNNGLVPWRKKLDANIIQLWRKADEFFDWYVSADKNLKKRNGSYSLSSRMAVDFKIDYAWTLNTIMRKFIGGWNPNNDKDWLEFHNS